MLVDIKTPAMGVNFFQHLHTASWQSNAFSNLKANLPETWTVSVMDFVKNRMVIYQDEIKGVYYSQEAITMHPIVVYHNTKDGVVRDSCVVISNDLVHDYHAVHHYQKIVENHVKGNIEKIDRRVIFSDGCSAQYKSKGPFADLAQDNHDNEQVDRNFFGSEHGKSDCDAETGVINRAVDRGIIGQEVVINSADDMYQYCNKKMSLDLPLSKRHFFYVEKGDIQRERPETEIKTLPESRRIHQVINTDDKMTLQSRNLSCFCLSCNEGKTECVNSDYVEPYKIRKLRLVTSSSKREMEPNKIEPPSGSRKRKQEETEESRPPKSQKIEESTPRKPPVYCTPTLEQGERRDVFIEEKCKVIENAQNFQDLLAKCTVIETELESYPVKGNDQISILGGGFTADAISVNLLGISQVPCIEITSLPVSVSPDGNCLPRTGSVFVFGDETKFKEMRLRIVVEMCVRKALYLDNEYLCRGSNLDEKEARRITTTYAMFSDQYVAGDMLTSVTVERVYEAEALHAIKSGTYMGIWQIFALSSILKSKIRSLYPPNVGNPLVRLHLNRVVMPFEEMCVTAKTILWTSTRTFDTAALWFPNHFVPVLPLTQVTPATDIDVVEHEFGDDHMCFDDCTPMENSSVLDLTHILEILSDRLVFKVFFASRNTLM